MAPLRALLGWCIKHRHSAVHTMSWSHSTEGFVKSESVHGAQ